MQTWLRLCLATGWCAAAVWAVDWKALRPQGAVSDFAAAIDAGSRSQLEVYCAQVENATGTRIMLVTLPSLENEPLEDVARTIFQAWRDPHRQRDDRVMLLLSVADRRRYVASGGGVKPAMADGLSRRVLREIGPALRRYDYAEAFRAAADTIGSAAFEAIPAGQRVAERSRLPRRLRWSVWAAIPLPAVAGGLAVLLVLMWVGAPAGYGGFGGRGLLPALIWRRRMSRSTWGSRGSGGFGGFDSGDDCGGFGGSGRCRDW